MPAALPALEPPELVEAARAPVEQQRVVVAAAFDVHALRDRVADVVALVVVLEGDARARGVERDTTSNGIPIGEPSQSPEPKSA